MEGVSEEGKSSEGEFPTGPFRPGESVRVERQKFARHRAEFASSHLSPGLQPSIHSSLHRSVQPLATHTDAPAPRSSLEMMLRDREGLARAVLLAEILGKPKALRSGR